MQPIPASTQYVNDLRDAYAQVKEMAGRLKRVFDKVEDGAIASGKAIPLVRLLHSVLRTQVQLIDKIQRHDNPMTNGREAAPAAPLERASSSLVNGPTTESAVPSPLRAPKEKNAKKALSPPGATPPTLLPTRHLPGAPIILRLDEAIRSKAPSSENHPPPALLMR